MAAAVVAFPVKLGLSLEGYYEGLEGDERVRVLQRRRQHHRAADQRASRFGRWNAHGGADFVRLGDSNALRLGDNTKVIISAGVGFSY